MNAFAWRVAGSIAVLVAVLAATLTGYYAWERSIRANERALVVADCNQKIDALQSAAAATLAAETAKADAATKALRAAKDLQENTDVANTKIVADLSNKLRAVRVLRDPGAAGCGGGGGSPPSGNTPAAGSGGADPAQASRVLSATATDFLFNYALEADEINVAYISCRQSLLSVQATK